MTYLNTSPSAKELAQLLPDSIHRSLLKIFRNLAEHGHACYLVGGAVRDLVMGSTPHEYDFTTSATPEQVKQIFKRVIDTGIQHGTVTVLDGGMQYEITTFRSEVGYSDGRRPDQIIYGSSLSDDLQRRDFTMNALALDLLENKFVDEHQGLQDIESKIIRTIGFAEERFSEDGLRAIRAIRFMATLGFTIEENTYLAIAKTRNITAKISTERFHDELNKILATKSPFSALWELHQNQIFSLFTKVSTRDSERHILQYTNSLPVVPQAFRLAYLMHFLAPDLLANQQTADLLLRPLKFSKKLIRESGFVLSILPKSYQTWDSHSVRQILAEIVAFVGLGELKSYADGFATHLQRLSSENARDFATLAEQVMLADDPLSLKQLSINGKEIMQHFPEISGKAIGDVLQKCLDLVLQTPEKNNHTDLLTFIKKIQL
ncbi:MAG: CCA tRNA nucleotidyltransferase [Spirochaetota bacterium]